MKATCATVLALLTLAKPLLAHHSYAMFAVDRTLTLTGTVKTWEWTNPHTWLLMVVPDAYGKAVEWHVEASSPAIWRKYGGNRDMFKPGDRVTVLIHPLRTGANGGLLEKVTTADGSTIDLTKAQP